MGRYIRYGLIGVGILHLIGAVGFFFAYPWATGLWPWQDSPLSYIFISSILDAIGVPVIWIGWSGEFAAAQGGALNLIITYGGAAMFLFQLSRAEDDQRLLYTSMAFAVLFLISVGIYAWSRRYTISDSRLLPAAVRYSFLVFSVVLFGVGCLLLLRQPNTFPWTLKPETSVIYGLIFWGAASYFLHATLRSKWTDGAGQLAGFLAYDLVLIGPLLAHFGNVLPDQRTSLFIYTAVLIYSGALAIYYLLINKPTQIWKKSS